ncbi:50S ribosomal protein L35 [Candidatus Microgenomates bacterium]|nr:50S ribosomal protein L35 [Candidatus Microgenomates bacterium]
MNKQKTTKAAAKRFKVTKTGKVMRGRQFGRHLRRKKSKSQKRRHQEPARVTGKIAKKIKRMLGK